MKELIPRIPHFGDGALGPFAMGNTYAKTHCVSTPTSFSNTKSNPSPRFESGDDQVPN
jgi:hypothetical protein